ncbi:O-antigen ligase family protein [Paraliobacillus sp. JSM ZJ581]|uniref:O-antigen ligase family protein n=1 Tax=Paraliobacillus sp. JSM ZJ581 TaxID=3342118 RepID=UPI0035A90C73
MRQLKSNTMQRIESIFLIFIFIQPILDLFAFLGLPISEVIRVLAIFIGMIYLLFNQNKKIQQLAFFYHIILILYFSIHLLVSYLFKEPFSLVVELTHITKTIFFIELLIVYVCVIFSISRKNNWQNILLRKVTISMAIIAVVMVLAELTNTGKRSYDMLLKAGHSGWFFSGNELSAILAMGFGFILLYFFRQKNTRVKMILFGLLGILCWAMMTIGTKVSFGGLILFLILAVIIGISEFFFRKKTMLHILIPSILFAATLIWLPFSSIGQNLHITLGPSFSPSTDTENQLLEEDAEGFNHILSGRSDFLKQTMQQYQDASPSQKLFGMGYGGNYQTEPKLIEMDLLDWLFGFGVIGFILLIAPICMIAVRLFKHIFLVKPIKLNWEVIMIGMSICIGFGAALVAGHVLSSPAVSIYLAIAIGYVYALTHPTVKNRTEG